VKTGNLGQDLEAEILIDVRFDVVDDAVDSSGVFAPQVLPPYVTHSLSQPSWNPQAALEREAAAFRNSIV
jgi:hypothetical protein